MTKKLGKKPPKHKATIHPWRLCPAGEHWVITLTVTREELNDPNVNICAGIRWLFWKKERASAKLGRNATWEEGVAEYKGVLKDWLAGKPTGTKNMAPFLKYLKKAGTCGIS